MDVEVTAPNEGDALFLPLPCERSERIREGGRGVRRLLLILPLLCSLAFAWLSPAQGQAGKPPVSMLTKEQKAELDALNKQAVAAARKGDMKTAETLFLQGLQKAEALKDAVSTAQFLHNLGNVYWSVGYKEKALDYFTRALALYEQIGSPANISATLNNLGLVYNSLGQNEKALDYYARALALLEEAGSPTSIAATLNNLGLVYHSLGQNEKALDYYTRALALKEKTGNPADIAGNLNNLGNIYYSLSQNEKALDYYTRALAMLEKVGNPASIAMTLNNLGLVYRDRDQNEKALDYYTRARALREQIGNPADIADSLYNLGELYSDLRQNEKALDYFTRARALYEQIGNPANIADTRNNLGELYSTLGKYEEAEKQFAESKRLRESFSLQVGDPSEVGALQEKFQNFYERYALLRLKRNLPEEALEMLEAGRGQGLTRQMDLSQRGDITRYFNAEERKGLKEKTQRLRDAVVQQREAEQQGETAKEGVQTAEREYDQYREFLFARYPQLRATAENQPAPFSRLRILASGHPDTLYLEWGVVDGKTSLLFALGSKDRLKPLTLAAGEKALEEVARKWRDALEISGGRGIQADRPKEKEKARTDEVTLAKQAYQLLLGEAEKAGLLAEGRYKRLVIVGSGPMLEMPLAALCDGKGRRLIERYGVSHAFSLSSFFYKNKTPQKAVSLFCLADPTGKKEQGIGEAEGQGRGRSAFRAGFAPLPGAREEGKAVAGLFPGSKLLIGPAAREAAVTRLLPEYGLLHFATHGYVVPRALDSGLVLAEEEAESQYTGLLTAKKILNVPLSAQLAVLSACETGRGVSRGGDGLMGLAWAFRAAGCPALVVSQWAVNDTATKEWMLAFYGALKAGKSKDVAVQAAMLAVKKAHPSPFYWAAFELIGETERLDLTPRPPSLETLP